MEGLSYGTQTAADALFGQFEGDSGNGEAMEILGSCSSSEWMFRICLTSFPKHVLADMRVVRCYAMFLTL